MNLFQSRTGEWCAELKANVPVTWLLGLILILLLVAGYQTASAQQSGMLVRLSEIDIAPADLKKYKTILAEESAASVRLEPGVVSIFPMYQKEKPTSIRILEIYASRAAYEAHIKSPHFQTYKTTTLPMVKSLKLVDMTAIDPATMPLVFKKIQDEK